jgi:hypothetical protein
VASRPEAGCSTGPRPCAFRRPSVGRRGTPSRRHPAPPQALGSGGLARVLPTPPAVSKIDRSARAYGQPYPCRCSVGSLDLQIAEVIPGVGAVGCLATRAERRDWLLASSASGASRTADVVLGWTPSGGAGMGDQQPGDHRRHDCRLSRATVARGDASASQSLAASKYIVLLIFRPSRHLCATPPGGPTRSPLRTKTREFGPDAGPVILS